MKIEIKTVNINVSREASDDADKLEGNNKTLRQHNKVLRDHVNEKADTIIELRRRIQEAGDIPPNTVTTDYHDEKIKSLEERFNLTVAQKRTLYGEIKLLEERLNQTVTTEYHDEKIKAYKERLDHTVAQKRTLYGEIKLLEDKIAGYELGMSKEEVTKECGKAEVTKKGKKRKNKRTLTKEEVWQIMRYIKAGRTNVWISNHTGLNIATIWKIKDKRTYTDVPAEPANAQSVLPTRWEHKPTTARAGHGVIKND